MNTTPTNIAEQIKAYFEQINGEKQAVMDQFKKELAALESAKKKKLKEIDSKWDEIRKAIPSSDSEKPVASKRIRMKDSEISEKIKGILDASSSGMKTDDLYNQIGIQRPRFDKYTKSPECIIKSEKAGKAFIWSLK
jgi:hypothetical protein